MTERDVARDGEQIVAIFGEWMLEDRRLRPKDQRKKRERDEDGGCAEKCRRKRCLFESSHHHVFESSLAVRFRNTPFSPLSSRFLPGGQKSGRINRYRCLPLGAKAQNVYGAQ